MKQSYLYLAAIILFFGCKTASNKTTTPRIKGDDGKIEVVFLQINDVYEISPIGVENVGGLARVAQIRKDLLAKNPNIYTVCAGDFISPSVIGTLKHEGQRIRGKQMVEVLNTLGLDYTAYGNHEFDYDFGDLQSRLDESKFTWIASNIQWVQKDGSKLPFSQTHDGIPTSCPQTVIISPKDGDGTSINLGIFTAVVPSNPKNYVAYEDHNAAISRSVEALRPKTDCMIGLTHLAAEDDKKLLAQYPEVPLIMGGHEHENQVHQVGKGKVVKADANAKTVYIHTLVYDKNTKTCAVTSELKKVDNTIKEDSATAVIVAKWESIKKKTLNSSGFDPEKTVTTLKEPLDCRETTVRSKQCQVGAIINAAMLAAAKTKPDAAFFNGGSIRVDDTFTGTLTELDMIRMLPFGGGIVEVEISGALLRKTLEQGLKNAGSGGYLQWGNITNPEAGTWIIGKKLLLDTEFYKIVLPEFLLTGNEKNLGYLKAEPTDTGTSNPDIRAINKPDTKDKTDLRNDIRLVLIAYWRSI